MNFLVTLLFPFLALAAWNEVPLSQMDVTSGAEGTRQLGSGLIEVNAPIFRATELTNPSTSAKLTFAFRGETEERDPTGGGEYRVQVGQKLLNENPCNLLYVMWRLYPSEVLVVSAKRYPADTSAECGNRGYTNLVPDQIPAGARSSAIPVPANLSARNGATRTLQSIYNRQTRVLEVKIGTQVVWRGHLPGALVDDLAGPAGIRSDNAQLRFRFYTGH